jgi:alpha-L-rhamnosidase
MKSMNGRGMTATEAAAYGEIAAHAAMIAPECDAGHDGAGTFVSRTFTLEKVPASAEIRISALGLYRSFINGQRVGDDLLTPGWTCYDDRLAFQTYDVAGLLREGENRIEIWLGNGWYRSQILWASNPVFNCWGETIAAIASITADGDVLLVTDDSWRSGFAPVLGNGIYYGEDFDARIVPADSHAVRVVEFDRSLLVPHEADGVKELAPLASVESWPEADGRIVYDFGQNAGAYIRLTVRGKAGSSVRVEHSEVLGTGRFFDNRNYRSARAELHYTLKGEGVEVYAPLFTFMGFRYARLTLTGDVELLSISMVPVSSVPVVAGGFTSGVAAVNKLVENTIWSQRSNFIEIPTDCPQRDERVGWTGDAQVFAGTACWLADSQRFLTKYLRDVMHDQRPNGAISHFSPDPTRLHPDKIPGDWAGSTGWGDAIVIIPWQLYLHYGDKAVLEACFPAMQGWLDYLWNISNGPVIRPPAVWGANGFTFGDWLQPVGDNRKPRPTIADDCAATLYHFISSELTGRIARIIGDTAAADRIDARVNEIRAAFKNEFFSASGRIAHNDQTSWALAFLYGLVPAEHEQAGRQYFRKVVEEADGKIGTGFIGTPALLPALTRLGMLDLAEKIFLNRKVPGWLYQVEHGATSIWERWDALAEDGSIYDPDMNSYNHYAYGAVCQWLFEDVAGIRPVADAPGFKVVELDPAIIPPLSPVTAWHDTALGRIDAAWSLEGNRVTYEVSLPEGMTGRIAAKNSRSEMSINGKVIGEGDVVQLGAGSHVMTFTI